MSQIDRTMGLVGNVAIKAPVRLATTANLALLAGLLVIDGIQTVEGDRILVWHQTDTTENGIYTADSGDWERAKDFDGNLDAVLGTLVYVTSGNTQGNTFFRVTTADPVVIDTSTVTFVQGLVNDAGTITFLQAGAGAVVRTLQSKERDIINPCDFGCVADGVTDDTVNFRLAMAAAAGRVLSGAGRQFRITAGLDIPSHSTWEEIDIVGNAAGAAIISADTKTDITLRSCRITSAGNFSCVNTFTSCTHITVEDCTFDGILVGPALSSTALRFQGSVDVIVRNNRFFDYDSFVYLQEAAAVQSDRVLVEGNYFEHTFVGATNNPTGVYQYKCDHVLVKGNTFKNIVAGGGAPISGYAVYVSDGSSISTIVIGNQAINTDATHKMTFMQDAQSPQSVCADNSFDPSAGSASVFYSGGTALQEIDIHDNVMKNANIIIGGGANAANATRFVNIHDNQLFKIQTNVAGIRVGVLGANYVNKASVKDNHVYCTYGSSINISQCNYATVEGNHCMNWNVTNHAPTTDYAYTAAIYMQNPQGVVRNNRIENDTQVGGEVGFPQYGIVVELGWTDMMVIGNSYPTKCTIRNEMFL